MSCWGCCTKCVTTADHFLVYLCLVAAVGALIALYLTGSTMSLIALLGLFLLIGIVMKNAILLIDFALQASVQQRDLTPQQAIVQAASARLRPVLMTLNTAAMLGAVPLLLALGEGSELRQPLGITSCRSVVY